MTKVQEEERIIGRMEVRKAGIGRTVLEGKERSKETRKKGVSQTMKRKEGKKEVSKENPCRSRIEAQIGKKNREKWKR